MLNFREISLADRAILHEHFYRADGHGSEYSFTNLLCWGEQRVAFLDGTPLILSRFGKHYSYLYPLCGNIREVLTQLRSDAHERGIPFRLFGLLSEETEELSRLFPGKFTFRPVRDSFDYVYDIERLCELRGKKLQAKRNHCNRFEDAYPDYRVLPLTPELLPRCQEFTEQWYHSHIEGGAGLDYAGECQAIGRAFTHFDALRMEGIAIETSDGLVAFSMGNRIREDTFDVNFEKALAEVNGAYPTVNREFARLLHTRYPALRFLNREDDMGIEGLRRAKESYFPDILLEKYLAEEIQ